MIDVLSIFGFNEGWRVADLKGLGKRIQFLRKERKITLVGMAKKSGIDPATLSRMENERMVGTVDSHRRICDVLGIRLPELYETITQKLEEARDKEARQKLEKFSQSSGVVTELLTTGVSQKRMMPTLLRLKAKGYSKTETHPAATERFVYLLKGAVSIKVGNQENLLYPGDSLYFRASTPHSFHNNAKTESELLSILLT